MWEEAQRTADEPLRPAPRRCSSPRCRDAVRARQPPDAQLGPRGRSRGRGAPAGERAGRSRRRMIVNDVHSRLNPTEVAEVVEVESLEGLLAAVRRAGDLGRAVCVAGGRHAMGGQQFVTGGTVLDTRSMRRVLAFDGERGLVEAEAGIQWPELIEFLVRTQDGDERQWGVRQKQTGADRLTLGGSVSANSHGRGLTLPPLVADVERLRLVAPDGSLGECSRDENA